jgi:hypothetical protein
MGDKERRKMLVELESELRRTSTSLAIAQADFEKAYTAMYEYMNEYTDAPQRILAFAPGVTMH